MYFIGHTGCACTGAESAERTLSGHEANASERIGDLDDNLRFPLGRAVGIHRIAGVVLCPPGPAAVVDLLMLTCHQTRLTMIRVGSNTECKQWDSGLEERALRPSTGTKVSEGNTWSVLMWISSGRRPCTDCCTSKHPSSFDGTFTALQASRVPVLC